MWYKDEFLENASHTSGCIYYLKTYYEGTWDEWYFILKGNFEDLWYHDSYYFKKYYDDTLFSWQYDENGFPI